LTQTPIHRSDFDSLADLYARFRHPYSPELFDTIARYAGASRALRALDVACGTGLSTLGLLQRGWSVTGVDAAPNMLAAARTAVADPRAAFHPARAESLPFADNAFGLLVCGQAFHWFDPESALREFARVLAPGGALAIFWKDGRADDRFERAVAGLLAEWTGGKRGPVQAMYETAKPQIWAETIGVGEARVDALFVDAQTRHLPFTIRYSVDSFIGYLASTESKRIALGDRREAFLEAARALIAGMAPPSGEFDVEQDQLVYLARRH
jgi:ubiquinone/menaquinone biosynthesis C-methylase UbiE